MDTLRIWNGAYRGEFPDDGILQADIYYYDGAGDPGTDFNVNLNVSLIAGFWSGGFE